MLSKAKQKTVFDTIVKKGVMIGSRQWGGSGKRSDWDFAISDEIASVFTEYLYKNDISIHTLRGSSDNKKHTMFNTKNIKFKVDGKLINLLTYTPEEVQHFRDINKIMDTLNETPIGEMLALNKVYRISTVESLINASFDVYSRDEYVAKINDAKVNDVEDDYEFDGGHEIDIDEDEIPF